MVYTKRRRGFLQLMGSISSVGLAGCEGLISGDSNGGGKSPSNVRWIPTRSTLHEKSPLTFNRGFPIFQQDVAELRDLKSTIPEKALQTYTRRFEPKYLPPGVSFKDLTKQIQVAEPPLKPSNGFEVSSFPSSQIGVFLRVTIADITKNDVQTAISDEYQQEADDSVTLFLSDHEKQPDIAVTDGYVIEGLFDTIRSAKAAAHDEGVPSVDSSEEYTLAQTELKDSTFHYVRLHDTHTKTDIDNERFVGQVAIGSGYKFMDDGVDRTEVRIFNSDTGVPKSALKKRANEGIANVADIDLTVEGRMAILTGTVTPSGYSIPYIDIALVPFAGIH